MTRPLSNRIVASALAAILMLGAWLPTVTVPAEAQFASAPISVELA